MWQSWVADLPRVTGRIFKHTRAVTLQGRPRGKTSAQVATKSAQHGLLHGCRFLGAVLSRICRGSAAPVGPPVDPLGLPLPPLLMDPRVTAALALTHFTKADFPDGPVTKLETRSGKEEPISHAENLSVGPEYVDHDFLGRGGRRRLFPPW